jgi:hypothetical protein
MDTKLANLTTLPQTLAMIDYLAVFVLAGIIWLALAIFRRWQPRLATDTGALAVSRKDGG